MSTEDALEAFIDESIRLSAQRNYHPTDFIRMRHQYGTIPAIERLVKTGEVQTGFKKLQSLDLLDWSIEAAVLKFPGCFSNDAKECAAFRLAAINDPALKSSRK